MSTFKLSVSGWARVLACAMIVTVSGIVGCEEDDAAFAPLVDEDAPSVIINDVTSDESQIEITASADDFIAVTQMVIEIRDPAQQVTEVNADGDTVVLGRLVAVDTTRFSGRVTEANVTVTFTNPFSQATIIDVRALARDSQENEGVAIARVVVGGGGTGGLGTPAISITSPLPNSTVRDNTLIRVGVSATDQTGLAQLNVVMSGVTTQPQADTTRFAEFRTQVDTLLDFFIPPGNLGSLTITAEAINLNSISAFATINVTVAQTVAGDTIPPTVSMQVSGGVQRRQNEAPRMETDDSLIVDIVASDDQTAVTRIGATYVITNATGAGQVSDTIFQDSVLNPAVSGTAPIRFALVPNTLPVSLFDPNNLPDTLFFEITGWAFDAASPNENCGATVDLLGAPNDLECSGTGPVLATGLSGGFTDRLIVQGRTVGFPQGARIADAVVDTLRELLLLSDLEFGLVRPFDLRAETFLGNEPVGSEPWGMAIDNTQDGLLVGNSGGTNISLIDLGPRTNPPTIVGETDRFQTQDLQVFQVEEDFDPVGNPIYPVIAFDFSDRPQFIAQAESDLILFSTRPAIENEQPGTIREFDPAQREIRFFIDYAERAAPNSPQIQVVNADSVFSVAGGQQFKICDHDRGFPATASCVFVPDDGDPLTGAFEEAEDDVAAMTPGWDTLILSDLVISSIGLQDTTFVTASGDREFIAFGEGDTPQRAGRIIMYESATQTITNSLQVTDLTGNAAQRVFGLALDNDGRLGVGRGEVAFFFGPDQPGGPNTLRLLGTNNDIQVSGTGAALHPDHDQGSVNVEDERLAFLGSGDASVEIVDTHFFDFKRGDLIIRDPIVGPLRITRRIQGLDPANVAVRLYGVTANGVVVIPVLDTDIDPIP